MRPSPEPPELARGVSVRDLLDDPALGLNVRLVAGANGLGRFIDHPRIQKSGLSLVGHVRGVVPSRIQVLGETELSYAETLSAESQRLAAECLFSLNLACVLVTRGVSAREMAKQLLRAGSSIEENLEEADAGQSRADFVSKCSISLKEARETHFWLRLLHASGKISAHDRAEELIQECHEIVAILTTIVKKSRATA